MKITILRFDSLASTNTEALGQARRGAAEGLCVVARRQTAGRGRQGRSWVSEEDAGIFFSIVLRPRLETRHLPLLTLMSAVAVHRLLAEEFGLEPDIKWPNDVLVGGRKICGILAETTDTPGGLAVVVGIGINLNSRNFPPELGGTATSIEESTDRPAAPDEVLGPLVRNLRELYRTIGEPDGPRKILREWAERSSFGEGKRVRVVLERETFTGTTRGLGENGALRVETDEGGIRLVRAGDVESLRPA